MTTEYRPVIGYEGCYVISDDGQVIRMATYGSKPRQCWKPLALRPKHGYITFHLCKNGIRKDPLAHILVWEAFCGPIPDGLEINHIDCVRSNNRLGNLELMTKAENAAYAYSHNGRLPVNNPSPGSKHGMAILTESDIPTIRLMAKSGQSLTMIAKVYGVVPQTIGYVVRGNSWRHVPA